MVKRTDKVIFHQERKINRIIERYKHYLSHNEYLIEIFTKKRIYHRKEYKSGMLILETSKMDIEKNIKNFEDKLEELKKKTRHNIRDVRF